MRISYWSSDLCSSDPVGNYLSLEPDLDIVKVRSAFGVMLLISWALGLVLFLGRHAIADLYGRPSIAEVMSLLALSFVIAPFGEPASALLTWQMRFRSLHNIGLRSEEHTSELQSLMRNSYAVFCLKQKKKTNKSHH